MYGIDLDRAVNTLVDTMLPAFHDKGLYIRLRVQTLDSWKSGAKTASAYIHFIFCRPSSYTKVFVCVSDKHTVPDIDKFTMKVDHDCCWREGVRESINNTYFWNSKRVNPRKAPANLKEFTDIDEVKFVEVQIKSVNPADSYMKEITKLIW